MASFSTLTEEALVHCYRMAVKLKLEPEFIRLLAQELDNRKLRVREQHNSDLY
jgi:hypothetical protein